MLTGAVHFLPTQTGDGVIALPSITKVFASASNGQYLFFATASAEKKPLQEDFCCAKLVRVEKAMFDAG